MLAQLPDADRRKQQAVDPRVSIRVRNDPQRSRSAERSCAVASVNTPGKTRKADFWSEFA
ncbi:hypothetical protein Q5424_05865 [Conexibacter sp. JD483]|uniref:hypothetical protein n=1 Tax=unclassified Conexibacter TaxID=2627773 RepID=UPI00271B9BC2|nr:MULTISPECIES: hypothetical protein [unclassified Conexibacter]MDO8185986.1 hypothetical protein [Conexibacter sp. CPCC 205706]MDR9368595.1 hypothetical protein [Conexibacter sp. JD483]